MDFEQTLEQLKIRLPDYLKSQGVSVNDSGFFKCINPTHPDRHPSCSIGGSEEYKGKIGHCFGCNFSFNIFTAAHILEKMPNEGDEFWNVTIAELCKRYDIPFSPLEISPKRKIEYQSIRAFRDATNIISNMIWENRNELKLKQHPASEHLNNRGITAETINEFNIGIITSHKEYITAMKNLGWVDKDFLQSLGLLSKTCITENGFMIPIYNLKNQPIGFATRHLNYDPDKTDSPKFSNSFASYIYDKSKILYNYNKAIKEPGPLYIVEGYLDAVYLWQAGIKKTAAIGATVITDDHVDMLYENETDIILAMDGDKSGYDGASTSLERLAPIKRFNISIIDLPSGYDPDTYVKEHGIGEFQSIEKLSPFKWSLSKVHYGVDLLTIAQRTIPTIAAELSSISRLKMIKELAAFTNVSENEIHKDVELILQKDRDEYINDLSDLKHHLNLQLVKKRPSEIRSILNEVTGRLDIIEEKHNVTSNKNYDFFNRITLLEKKLIGNYYNYGLMSPKYRTFERTLDGIPFWCNLMYIAGRSSSGKTSFLTSLSLELIKNNEDLAIFYMSIDDTTEMLATKIMAVESGLSTSEIKNYTTLDQEQKDKFQNASDFLKEISKRYIIADASQGTTLDSMENHIKFLMREFQDKKKLFLLDNFHKLDMDVRGQNSRRDALSESSSRIKKMTQINDLSIIATVELRKLANEVDRPTRQDMLGTGKLDYDADVIGLMHCDKQVKEAANKSSVIVHRKEINGEEVLMPWLEVKIAKNKINGKEGDCPFLFNKHNLQIDEGSISEWKRLSAVNKRTSGVNF